MTKTKIMIIVTVLFFLNVHPLHAQSIDELQQQIKEIERREKTFHFLEQSNKGLIVLFNAKKVEDDVTGEINKVFQKCNVPLSTGFGWLLKADKKMSDVTINTIKEDQAEVKRNLEILANAKNEIQKQLKQPNTPNLRSLKGVIDLPSPDDHKAEPPTQQVASQKEGQGKSGNKGGTVNLEHYENMTKADLRKELESKIGHKLDNSYDKKSKRELISELTGTPKEQIHTASSDKGKDPAKDLDRYEKMDKKDLQKELEKKLGHKGDYDKMSAREMVSALTGVPKEKVQMAGKDKEEQAQKNEPKDKDLGHYENMTKSDLRKELEKKNGPKDNYDKMSKRELISALTGVPKDKIGKDDKDKKDQAKSKGDDGNKKDSKDKGQTTKLTKQQVEEIWKARPDVAKDAGSHKGVDPYKQTEKWWDKYGQKEMKDFQFASTPSTAAPSSNSAQTIPASPTTKAVTKLSKEQAEQIWKARPDVAKDAKSHKGVDPYKQTQKWWDKYGQKEMSTFFAAAPTPATPPAAPAPPTTSASSSSPPAATPAPSPATPAANPITKLTKAQAEEIWKARPDVAKDARSHKGVDPYKQTQKWWDKFGIKEMGGYQFAGTTPPPASTSPPPVTSAPPATPLPAPNVSTPTPIPSGPVSAPVASQPAPPAPSTPAPSSPSKLGGSAKVIVGGKEVQDGKYVMDGGYWIIKNGKIVSTGPTADMRGRPLVDTKDAIAIGPNDKLIIDGHEKKVGYRTLVGPVKSPEVQKPGEGPKPQKEQLGLKEAGQHQVPKKKQKAPEDQQRRAGAEQRKTNEQQYRDQKEEQQKAKLEAKRHKEEQRRVEQERQRQAKLEAKRLQEEQKKQQAEQRKAQDQQRRLEVQRRQQEEQQQRTKQKQIRRQQEIDRQAQIKQQRQQLLLQQQEQRRQAKLQQQLRQQEAAKQRQQQQKQQQRSGMASP